jgi:DNA-directed RNA polymerase subunit M/transcription elongation factor TFIIS
MASPGSIAASDDAASKPVEQITFRFCSECSNMLYPKEDPDNNRLQFTCRTCHYTEEASSTCVFRNVMNTSAGETAGVTQDVGSDPTVRDLQHDASLLSPEMCLCCGDAILCGQCREPSDSFVVNTPNISDPAISELDDEIDDEMDSLFGTGIYLYMYGNNKTARRSSCDIYDDLCIDDAHVVGFGMAVTPDGEVIQSFSQPGLHDCMADKYLDWSSSTETDSSDEEMTDI